MEALAHRLDARAHAGDLVLPLLAQRRIAHHHRRDLAAIGRRARIVGADGELELAEHALGLLGAGADDRKTAAALAVPGQVLGKRVGDEEGNAGVGHGAHRMSVLLDAVAEALVGHVHERNELARRDDRDDLGPLLARQVDAGRVVAARMQQHDALLRHRLQRLKHRVEAHAARRRVVIGIVADAEAGELEQRAVVVPGGIADEDLAVGEVALEEVAADLQCAGAADGLDRGDALAAHRLVPGAEDQLLDGLPVVGRALDRLVAARLGVLRAPRLGLTHRRQHGDAPVAVVIEADADIDLARPRILVEGVDDREDGVAGIGFDVLEHGGALGNCAAAISTAAPGDNCRRGRFRPD